MDNDFVKKEMKSILWGISQHSIQYRRLIEKDAVDGINVDANTRFVIYLEHLKERLVRIDEHLNLNE